MRYTRFEIEHDPGADHPYNVAVRRIDGSSTGEFVLSKGVDSVEISLGRGRNVEVEAESLVLSGGVRNWDISFREDTLSPSGPDGAGGRAKQVAVLEAPTDCDHPVIGIENV